MLTKKLDQPWGLSIDANGSFIVCDSANSCVKMYSRDGTFKMRLGDKGIKDKHGGMENPGTAILDSDGNLLVTSSRKIQKFVYDASNVNTPLCYTW